ncbi:MAG: MoaD/ThiS family protein [Proteobacteria bacterium]|nr:MoaD/ThiS family protein [Pseudomonadota bacterium]
MINGITLDPEQIRNKKIQNGDIVSIFPLVAGG